LDLQTGYYPFVEYTNGELTAKMKITKKEPIENFLKIQKRFKHLFKDETGKTEIAKWQALCDKNIAEFDLLS
jgi:pyruvate ferredoxin oxidoreductase beta subunit